MVCKSKSDSTLSSRVLVNASINSGGRSWINPIVSLIRSSCHELVKSVMNSLLSNPPPFGSTPRVPCPSLCSLECFVKEDAGIADTRILPTLVPSVAKSLSAERTCLLHSALNSVDLPALVYHTIPTVCSPWRLRR